MDSFVHKIHNFFHGPQFQEVYKVIFGTPQFPFWFVIQAIWECYIIKRSQIPSTNSSLKITSKTNKRKKPENKSINKEIENKNSKNNDENSGQNANRNQTDENVENLNEKVKNDDNSNDKNETRKAKEPLITTRKIIDIILSYILCFSMNFLQRELFALLFKMPSPIKKNANLIIIFTLIFVFIFCIPFDIIFKIIHFMPFSFILGAFQGANQIRFFRLTLRHATKLSNPIQYVPIVICFFVFDSFIGFFFSPLFNRNGRRTLVSNGNTICDYIIFIIIYLTLTIPNKFSKDVLHGIKITDTYAAFFLVITVGLYNGINAIRNDRKSRN